MTSSPSARSGRTRTAFVRFGGLLLALVCAAILFAPTARSASPPKIVSVDVTGNVHVPVSTIMAAVQAKPGQPYDPAVVQGDLQRIDALGYFEDLAPPLIRQRPGGVAITYRVIENPVVTKIAFVGNTHVPSDTLLALMDTTVGQVLNTATLKADFLKIDSYYDRIGYGGQVPTHIANLNIDPKTGALTIDIREGLTISNIEFGGDPVLPRSVLLTAISAKKGDVYSDALGQKDIDALQKLYDKYDLALAQGEPGLDATTIDQKTGTAAVKYTLYAMRVGVVQITGNSKTKDYVIRRYLSLRYPGQLVTVGAVHRDNERLMNTGYFSKVDLSVKAGPDPKDHPGWVTLDWNVTEQRTAQAQVGFGYSGGLTGQGLFGTLGYSDNNLHGSGNAVSVQFERGANVYQTQASVSIPYLGNTPKLEKYSIGATVFGNGSTYFFPVYTTGTVPPGATSIPVTIVSSGGNAQLVPNVVSTSLSKVSGGTLTIGRRFTQSLLGSVGINLESVSDSTTVPPPYTFAGAQPGVLAGPTPGPFASNTNFTGTIGVAASSLVNTNTGLPYRLHSLSFGVGLDPQVTVDDIFNPRRGEKANLTETISTPSIGSDFSFTQTSLDLAKYFPVLRTATLALHGQIQTTTGAIPYSQLYAFSDQQLRGYNSVFYGTDTVLGQIELRIPLTPDRKFGIAIFGDEGGFRIRGAQPQLDPYTNRITNYPGNWTYLGDVGVGLRFDIQQLGLHTIRIDIAHGVNGTHTSFGIGQSF